MLRPQLAWMLVSASFVITTLSISQTYGQGTQQGKGLRLVVSQTAAPYAGGEKDRAVVWSIGNSTGHVLTVRLVHKGDPPVALNYVPIAANTTASLWLPTGVYHVTANLYDDSSVEAKFDQELKPGSTFQTRFRMGQPTEGSANSPVGTPGQASTSALRLAQGDVTADSVRTPVDQTRNQDHDPSSRTVALQSVRDIQAEIGKIRAATHATMPRPEAVSAVRGGTSITIKNGTGYKVSVYLTGPLNRVLEIPADGVETLSLPSGRYEMGATVSSPGIRPFYAVEKFAPNVQYSESINYFERP
jgi:hypothetical protein